MKLKPPLVRKSLCLRFTVQETANHRSSNPRLRDTSESPNRRDNSSKPGSNRSDHLTGHCDNHFVSRDHLGSAVEVRDRGHLAEKEKRYSDPSAGSMDPVIISFLKPDDREEEAVNRMSRSNTISVISDENDAKDAYDLK